MFHWINCLFLEPLDAHVEQLLYELVVGFLSQFHYLRRHHVLLYIFERLGILAEFIDLCGITICSSTIRIFQKQILKRIKLRQPNFRSLL